MANLHPTTDTDFQNRQYGFELPNPQRTSTSNGQGVRRASVDRQTQTTDQRRMSARPRLFAPGTENPARRLQTRSVTRAMPVRYSPIEHAGVKTTTRKNSSKKHIDPVERAAATARAATTSLIIFSWSATIYLCVQLPFAVFSLVMLGASAAVADSWVASATAWVWNMASYILGFPAIDITTFFFIGYIIALISGYICLLGGLAQYMLVFLNPLGGVEGGTVKKASFLLAFTLYAVPGFNLFPWLWLWLLAVTRYPK